MYIYAHWKMTCSTFHWWVMFTLLLRRCVTEHNSVINMKKSDCFLEYNTDIHRYKNIFIEIDNLDNVDLKFGECMTAESSDHKIERSEVITGSDVGESSSFGQCHLIPRQDSGTGVCNTQGYFHYPEATRIDPGDVGDIKEIFLRSGVVHKLVTKSITPPVFEVPSFLSSKECDYIMGKAMENGLATSGLTGSNISDQLNSSRSLADIDRISETSWLWKANLGESVWLKLRKRVSKLTRLPIEAIKVSEAIQVVQYLPGGHYHAHLDTTLNFDLPCCFQRADCIKTIHTDQWDKCCRFCRYATLMIYLNDTEEGGETAFPFADIDDELLEKQMDEGNWYNLSRDCHKASLRVTPEKGKAVLWYNHDVDDTGYLGEPIIQSYHGGCDVIKGSKWIANFWILWPPYEYRFERSRFYTEL